MALTSTTIKDPAGSQVRLAEFEYHLARQVPEIKLTLKRGSHKQADWAKLHKRQGGNHVLRFGRADTGGYDAEYLEDIYSVTFYDQEQGNEYIR